MSKRYTSPYALKPKLLAWSELNLHEVETIINLFQNQSTNDCYNYLERHFSLNSTRFREKILLDLHYFAIKFAVVQCSFSKIQVSAFISIIRALHKANQETPFDNYNYLLDYFRGLMICHSVNRPPFCIKIFDSQAVAKAINFINSTYIKNVKLYKYVFTPIVGVNIKLNYSNERPDASFTESPTYYPELIYPRTQGGAKESSEITEHHKGLNLTHPKILPMVLPEISTIQTMSSFSSELDLKNYVRQFLIEELDSEPIREKLSELEDEVFRSKHNL